MGGIISKTANNDSKISIEGKENVDLPDTDRDLTTSYSESLVNNAPLKKRRCGILFVKLDSSKSLDNKVKILKKTMDDVEDDINCLSGLYAYCVVQSIDLAQQYLLLKNMKGHESDHAIFQLFVKYLPAYDTSPMQIIAGGEITMNNGLVCWNLKSSGYSLSSKFNESQADFADNIETIWLPSDKYQTIAEAEGYSSKFKENGEFLSTKQKTEIGEFKKRIQSIMNSRNIEENETTPQGKST